MSLHPLAGHPAPRSALTNIPRLVASYYALEPDAQVPAERVAFGTSGHRGSALSASFNERHILAVTQALCHYRQQAGINGPLFLGKDTHALSEPALITALEVLAANAVDVFIDEHDGYTPTPVISHAILTHNRDRKQGLADGVLITPSHNPPEDGGFKYNPPNGGPADTDVTALIERKANELLQADNRGVRRIPFQRALTASTTHRRDYLSPYLDDLATALDLDAIRAAGPKLGVDPLGGASVAYWQRLASDYRLPLSLVDDTVDPTFGFMRLDHDGRIRMDCSSPYAMAGLVALKDHYAVAFGNDADADRHGIVVPGAGLLNPNHYLAVAIAYLFTHRPEWPASAAIGKTLVSSSLIDRVARKLDRPLIEVPVGFKWFVAGLHSGALGFAGEESAGASFLRRDGSVWTTDKDGLLLSLLAAEICAVTGKDPGEHYQALTAELGEPVYQRLDNRATPAQKAKLKQLSPAQVTATTLAGEPITAKLTRAPGNDASIGGLKVQTANGWFAARPSGTEDVYKIYAESFLGPDHLQRLQQEAAAIVSAAMGGE